MASPNRDPGAFRQNATIAPIHEEQALGPAAQKAGAIQARPTLDDFGFRDHAPGVEIQVRLTRHRTRRTRKVFRLFS
jgi:hypothetical protein